MNSVLVTGCNRGIGYGLINHFLKLTNPPKYVIATCRSKDKATSLTSLAEQNSNLHILEIDLNDFERYDEVAKKVSDIVKDDGLNLLINNAGITTKFTRVGQVKREQMVNNFIINTVAPLMLTKTLIPLLKKASANNPEQVYSASKAAVVNISSILGSIHENKDGGFYPYRASKSALNACTKSLSLDLKSDQILVTSIHPGWCKTDMGGKNAPLDVDVAVPEIIKTIQKLSETDNGNFIQYDGKALPW